MTKASAMIGELNGRWAVLFKVSLVVTPIFFTTIIGWGTWVTNRIYQNDVAIARVDAFIAQGPRFTSVDAQLLEYRVVSTAAEKSEARYQELIRRIDALADTLNNVKLEIARDP